MVGRVPLTVDSPVLRIVQKSPTDYWNDSCAVDDLTYAVYRGATGATSNPSILFEVLKREQSRWLPGIRDIAANNPAWSETELAWAVIEQMAVRGAGVLLLVSRGNKEETAAYRYRPIP